MSDRAQFKPEQLAELQRVHNPHNEPTGHFTGRCMRCGSNDLWDDNAAYGCNTCHGMWCGLEPRLVPNGPRG